MSRRKDITTNIVLLIKKDEILLAMKKRGFGAGNWNGVGGKVDSDETVEQSAVREAKEEIKVDFAEENLEHMADLHFYFEDGAYVGSRVYFVRRWSGEPFETEEMAPKWYKFDEIPYDQMWDDDKLWLPRVIDGEKLNCEFDFDNNNKVKNYIIN